MTAAAHAEAGPLIGFGQVRHTRLRPRHHAFAYPTFFLMLPLRQLEQGHPVLAVNRRGLISFHERDHGDGRSVAEGGEIWLHCYPRVLGYTFNPVSFWYCHRPNGSLRAIVVEVNNTFGERHCYLLDAPHYGQELHASKVFHVSPFCAVTGDYRFRFLRTQHGGEDRTVVRIDHDNAEGPLLQTSVSGTLLPVTAATLRRALTGYPALTLAVMARIHWQAFRLWIKRVRFHSKPTPPTTRVSR